MKKLYFFLFSILILSACEPGGNGGIPAEPSADFSPQNEAVEMATDGFVGRKMMSTQAGNFNNEIQDQKIITTGNLNLEVKDIEDFEKSIPELLKKYGAHITNQSSNDNDQRLEANYTIRVPAKNFDQLFKGLQPLAKKIAFQSQNQQDVTEQYIDLETRLKNRKALEDRYRELLKKATDINDIMNIERQLNQVRSEIESQEGRLKYLNDQIDMSTIHLNAYEVKPYVYEPEEQDNFGQRILNSLANGWHGFVGGIIWLISLWPLLIVFFLIVFAFKKKSKK